MEFVSVTLNTGRKVKFYIHTTHPAISILPKPQRYLGDYVIIPELHKTIYEQIFANSSRSKYYLPISEFDSYVNTDFLTPAGIKLFFSIISQGKYPTDSIKYVEDTFVRLYEQLFNKESNVEENIELRLRNAMLESHISQLRGIVEENEYNIQMIENDYQQHIIRMEYEHKSSTLSSEIREKEYELVILRERARRLKQIHESHLMFESEYESKCEMRDSKPSKKSSMRSQSS